LKTFVFLGVSLDGYIARTDGNLDFLDLYQDGAEDFGYSDFINEACPHMKIKRFKKNGLPALRMPVRIGMPFIGG
jgi:hypothetical protein